MHQRFDSNELNQWVITQAETAFPGIKIFERCLCTVQLEELCAAALSCLHTTFLKLIFHWPIFLCPRLGTNEGFAEVSLNHLHVNGSILGGSLSLKLQFVVKELPR